MKQRYYIEMMLVWAMALLCACSDEQPIDPSHGGVIQLSAARQHIITRAGDEVSEFVEGTKYYIVAQTNGTTYDWNDPYLKETGTEQSNHTIKLDDADLPTYPATGSLDFFGTTYGVAGENAPAIAEDGTVTLSEVKDLMYSNNLKAQTAANGVLQMDFRHALSLLTFEVVKQADVDALSNVLLTKVEVRGTHTSGTFDIVDEKWELPESSVNRTFYADATGMNVDIAPTSVDGEMYLIPNNDQPITIALTLSIAGESKEIEYVLKETVEEEGIVKETNNAFSFLPNHKYKLTITVLGNDVRVVAILPQVYEWIDLPLNQQDILSQDNDIYLGQPVTFGNLMWMDRNLGANSADCQNDWYNTIGYYYQHGRNIPFILDVEVWKAKRKTSDRSYSFASHAALASTFPDKFMYTWGKNGEKVFDIIGPRAPEGTTATQLKNDKTIKFITDHYPLYDEVAKKVGDDGVYGYLQGWALTSKNTNWKTWAITSRDLDVTRANEHDDNDNFWYDNETQTAKIENQPCPKGWRLPNRSDLYAFMPETNLLSWNDTHFEDLTNHVLQDENNNDLKDPDYANYRRGKGNDVSAENYDWCYFAGKFIIDSSVSRDVEYSTPMADNYGRVYGIKYEGTEKAYRIMVEQIEANETNKRYARIYRFNATKDDEFLLSDDKKQWNLHLFDWEHPVEYMDFPLCGYMFENGLTDFGTGSIVRISQADMTGTRIGVNWTLYLRSTHNGVAVAGNSRRNLGDQIRCVRDINVKE